MIPAKPFNHQLGYILKKNRSSHIQLQLGFFRNLIYLFLAWLPEFLHF
jgi:cyanate permease